MARTLSQGLVFTSPPSRPLRRTGSSAPAAKRPALGEGGLPKVPIRTSENGRGAPLSSKRGANVPAQRSCFAKKGGEGSPFGVQRNWLVCSVGYRERLFITPRIPWVWST